MLSEYEYAQAVMKAAGVVPSYLPHDFSDPDGNGFSHECLLCGESSLGIGRAYAGRCFLALIYPNPLKSGDALLALIDALREKGLWVIATISDSNGSGYRVEIRRGSHGDAWAETFQAALVEAAGQALGVSRG